MARIAVIEDAAPVRQIVEAVLTDRDHHVDAFEDITSAKAGLSDNPPDLLIVDILLPDGSGLDLVAHMRDRHPDLPIVVTSGLHTEEDFRAGFVAGATDYIRKPFVAGELVAKCEAHLSRRIDATTCQVPTSPKEAQPFGRYQIEGVVGRGANGVVFRALDARTGGPVALKVLSTMTSEAEPRLRFLRETYALSSVRHSHVVPVLDFGIQEGRLYYTMPVIEGPTLRRHVKPGQTANAEELRGLVTAIASALQEIHGQNLIHRDVSPSNVILQDADWSHPMLIDFGLAKHVFDHALTNSDMLIGTPGYLDPALLRDALPGPPTDVYALGALARFAFVGRDPHANAQGLARVRAMRDDPPEIPEEIPEPLRSLLARAMDPEPNQRPSASDILAGLA